MSELSDESVHLIVTSPPYFDARNYQNPEQIGFGDTAQKYIEDIKQVFKECIRALQKGRKFCLNISDLPVSGEWGVKWLPLSSWLLQTAMDVGFELADRIIWAKVPMKGFQYGSLPYPPSPLICDSMEYVFILRKPGKSNYKYLSKSNKEASKMEPSQYREFTKQIWTMRRVRLKENLDGHIAPFPIELPLRCIELYSFVGDLVLDPFGGSGTTSAAASKINRNSILYEINANYITLIEEKIRQEHTFFNDLLIEKEVKSTVKQGVRRAHAV